MLLIPAATLALFGVVPVKTVRAVTTARRTVQLCGTPFGVKLFSDGALVVAFSDRYTALGSENPAKAAGLRLGDLIISANGQPVRSNEDLTSAIQAADGAPYLPAPAAAIAGPLSIRDRICAPLSGT
mgnify:CR=1 FL=1